MYLRNIRKTVFEYYMHNTLLLEFVLLLFIRLSNLFVTAVIVRYITKFKATCLIS